MKTPDAALLRARAKAPLPHLHALHLSGADLASLRNLEPCCRLRSLYANANVLKDIDGLTSLRCLWRIDLSDNRMRQLTALASFPALGFLQLERNQLGFEDLVWLRDVHILDLRLIGNPALLAAGADRVATIEYRMKVVALLPLVWTLDGHYISTSERAQAIEAYDDWVLPLLASHTDGALRFGSTCDLWGGVVSGLNPEDLTTPVQQDVLQLLEAIEKQPTRHPDKQDLYRLGTLAAFYDRERDVHNAHAQFAPQRHAPTAKLMPTIRLHQLQTLSPRARLETAVLLAAHVAFPLPTKLLTEALTISILSDGDSDSGSVAWAQDLVSLPVYGVVAVVSTLRFQAMAEYGENCSPSSIDPSDPIQIWTAMPVVLQTLLQSERHIQLVERSTPDPYYRQRCALAVSLLARASTFPSKPPPNVYDLVATAKLASMHTLTHLRFAIPTVLVGDSSSSAMSWKKLHPNQPDRDYRKPWSERAHLTESVSSPDVRSPITRHKRRRPKTGEWLEVQPKLFLKIRSVSADGEMLTVSPGTSNDISHATITIYMDQITYVSCSMWRLVDDDPHTLEEIRNVLSQKPSAMKSRLGKLHRDAEGFHKHGAFRNQGYPNHTVSTEDLQTIPFGDDERVTVRAMQAQPIEVFSSTDTLDANYVLTSPALINVQNAVASRAFYNRRQAPAGLWNPIETASFRVTHSMDAATPVQVEATLMASKVKKIKSKKGCHPQQPHDEWRELQEDMQALLGIRSSAADSVDATCFMTSVPAEHGLEGRCVDSTRSSNGSEILCATTPTPMLNDEPSPVCVSTISAPRSSAKPRKLAALPWHQVSTKPQLLVAAASPLAPKRKDTGKTAATAGHVSVTELDAAVASMARSSSSASTARLASLRLTFEGSLPNKHAKHAKHRIPFTPVVADTMAATMPMTLDAPTFDSIPRLRWSDADHRFHFNMPFAAEPGDDGFVLLQQIDDSDSLNAMSLPPSERQHIKEMERFNAMIKEVENSAHLRDTVKYLERQRAHSDEFHERVVTEDDLKPRVVKKKSFNRGKTSPKQAFNQLRQKPTRMGRVQQPK